MLSQRTVCSPVWKSQQANVAWYWQLLLPGLTLSVEGSSRKHLQTLERHVNGQVKGDEGGSVDPESHFLVFYSLASAFLS